MQLVTLLVGLICLAPLNVCLALPASPLSLDTQSPSVTPPPSSGWDTDSETSGPRSLYGHHADPGLLNKRDKVPDVVAKYEDESQETWLVSRQQDRKFLGILEKGEKTQYQGSDGEVLNGKWGPGDGCQPVPVVIKISKGLKGYYAARNISNLESPYVVKVHQSAQSEDGGSVVAYEKLGTDAHTIWEQRKELGHDFYESALGGLLAGLKRNMIYVDAKFENLLRADQDTGGRTVWKWIDWDDFVLGGPGTKMTDLVGTYGFFPPEAVATELKISSGAMLGLKKKWTEWEAGPGSVFSLAMMIFHSQNPKYQGVITKGMRNLKKKFEAKLEPKVFGQIWKIEDDDYMWSWIAILEAFFNGKYSRKAILKLLPSSYRKGSAQDKAWGEWFSNTLCEPKKRYTLEQAKKAYDDLRKVK